MHGSLTLYWGPASSQGSLWLPTASQHTPALPAPGQGKPVLQSLTQHKQCNSRVWAVAWRRPVEAKARADLKRGQAIAHAGLKRPLTQPLMRCSGLSLHLVQQRRHDLGYC